ncbi:MAG: DUF892 family protein [Acidobacteria bacterium]|nr:DUF892 family protein [Acidobacteriota bacterium]
MARHPSLGNRSCRLRLGESADTSCTFDAGSSTTVRELYEIASYGTARVWANLLGRTEVAGLLEEILEEEKTGDKKLSGIAEGFVNQAAAQEDEDVMARPRGRRARSVRQGRQAAADTVARRARAGARAKTVGRGRS